MTNKEPFFHLELNRRGFLKTSIAAGFTLATAGLVKLFASRELELVQAYSGSGPNYYGTDTSWAVDTKGTNASNFPQNFYIGRTGVGELIYNDSSFYPTAADKANFSYTHTYWNVKGPYYKYRGGRSAQQYGHDQGIKAASAWYDHYWASKIGGKTIFADIEEGQSNDPNSDLYDGWRYLNNGNYYVDLASNRAVLEGFLDGIKDYRRNGADPVFNPGIYTRSDLWQNWFGGANYDPKRDFVLWLAGNACGFSCSPCGSCSTAKSEADSKFIAKKATSFGKYMTVIWQFFTSECPAPDCADYDIALQNGYIWFKPIYATFLPLIMNGYGGVGAQGYPPPGQSSSSINSPSTDNPSGAYPAPGVDH